MWIVRKLPMLAAMTVICVELAFLANRSPMDFGLETAMGAEDSVTIQGTGATFPAPLYQKWFTEFNKEHPNVQINYQALGSGAGIKQFQQHLVDFGASDAAMTDAEIAPVKEGVVLLPMTAGAIVLAYNVPGITDLKLSRQAYAGIFLGKITNWNDPARLRRPTLESLYRIPRSMSSAVLTAVVPPSSSPPI